MTFIFKLTLFYLGSLAIMAFAADESDVTGKGSCEQKMIVAPSAEAILAAVKSGGISATFVLKNKHVYNLEDPKILLEIQNIELHGVPKKSLGDIAGAKMRAPNYGMHILKYIDDASLTETNEFPEIIRLAMHTPIAHIPTEKRILLYMNHLKKYGVKESWQWMEPVAMQDPALAMIYVFEFTRSLAGDPE